VLLDGDWVGEDPERLGTLPKVELKLPSFGRLVGEFRGVRRAKLMYDQFVKVKPEKRRSCHLRTELCTWRSNPPP
jgi:hypothetical protein